jgi:hypothetical protein
MRDVNPQNEADELKKLYRECPWCMGGRRHQTRSKRRRFDGTELERFRQKDGEVSSVLRIRQIVDR